MMSGTLPRWLSTLALVIIGGSAIALSILALAHVRPAPGDDSTAPPVSLAPPSVTPLLPSPTPTDLRGTKSYDRSKERFLTSASGVLWRGIAGSCGESDPLLERSVDGGTTWRDVTPRYLGIAQLLSLRSFADEQAEVVALMGADCEAQALRTFTQGQYWESYPDALAASQYLDPTDPSSIVRMDSTLTAPCAESRSLRDSETALALVCEGVAYILREGVDWDALPAVGAQAVAVDASDVVVAHRSDACDGIAITRYALTDPRVERGSKCLPGSVSEVAIAISEAGVTTWSGQDIVTQ